MTAANLPVMFKNGNKRLEECLRILVAKTYSQSRGLRGNKKVSFCNQTKSIQVSLDELAVSKNAFKNARKIKKNWKNKFKTLKRDARCCYRKSWMDKLK